jgi:acyl-CoA thioester hydrolase
MKGFAVTLELPVLWGDMDALRHVNNTRYFSWFESARIAYFDRVGAIPGGGKVVGLGEVGPILAGARVIEIGKSSLRMEYAVARTDAPEDLCAKGTGVVVLVRYATLEKVRLPDEVRVAIAALEQQAA